MAKNSITDYSKTASLNTDIQSVDIDEGCLPSGINNAIRELMADLADMNDGTVTLTSPSFAAATITGDLTVDTNTLHVDSTNNRVGIGTSSPSAALHVVDSSGDAFVKIEATENLSSSDSILRMTTTNTAASAKIQMGDTGDVDIGQIEYDNGDNSMRFQTNATERMRIDSSGNVGIGTSSPSALLNAVDASGSGTATQIASGTAHSQTRFAARTEGYNGIMSLYDSGGTEDVRLSAKSGQDSYINNGGNVGIGTSSPTDSQLDVRGTAGVKIGDGTCTLELLGRSDLGYAIIGTDTNHPIAMRTNNTERMRIDSSGRVGINQSTGLSGKLNIQTDNLEGIRIYRSGVNANYGAITFNDDTNANREARIGWQSNELRLEGTSIISYHTSTTERMRIDSSGNVLVGTTDTTLFNDNADEYGFMVEPSGQMQLSANNATMLYLNRQNGDGTIVDFRKDGTNVGSIGVEGGDNFYITDNNNTGLNMKSGLIIPCNTNGSTRDNAIDLGASGGRFNDLYLGGGVYVGGTGSANHLDDYEEGTWTPTVTSGTISQASGTYRKIGSLCTVTGIIGTFSDRTSTAPIGLTGLPFNIGKTDAAYPSGNMTVGFNERPDTAYALNSTTIRLYNSQSAGSSYVFVAYNDLNLSGSAMYFSFTYITA